MTFQWKDFLTLANYLNSNPDLCDCTEASYRSVASRAYYSVYHIALGFARIEGFYPNFTGDDHIKLAKHFKDFSNDPVRKKIALDLDRLRERRIQSDYESKLKSQPVSIAYYALNLANSILTKLDSLNPP